MCLSVRVSVCLCHSRTHTGVAHEANYVSAAFMRQGRLVDLAWLVQCATCVPPFITAAEPELDETALKSVYRETVTVEFIPAQVVRLW